MEKITPYLVSTLALLFAFGSILSISAAAQTQSPVESTIVIHGHTIHIIDNSTLVETRKPSTIQRVMYTTYVFTAHRIYWCSYPFMLGLSWDEISYTVAWTVLSTTGQITGYYNPGDPSYSWGGLGCGLEFSTASNSASAISPWTVHWYAAFNTMFGACPACYNIGTDFISINGYAAGTVSASWS